MLLITKTQQAAVKKILTELSVNAVLNEMPAPVRIFTWSHPAINHNTADMPMMVLMEFFLVLFLPANVSAFMR